MDREVPEGCEVWPAPEQLRQSADLRLVAEQGPALPDKPVHGVPARQTGKRRHQRRVAHEVDVSDLVASPRRRHQFPVEGREGLRQGIYLAVLDARPRVLPRRVYFFSAGALDADFAIDVVGTMMWAYGVPFHITHGPPLVQSVGYASS